MCSWCQNIHKKLFSSKIQYGCQNRKWCTSAKKTADMVQSRVVVHKNLKSVVCFMFQNWVLTLWRCSCKYSLVFAKKRSLKLSFFRHHKTFPNSFKAPNFACALCPRLSTSSSWLLSICHAWHQRSKCAPFQCRKAPKIWEQMRARQDFELY